MAIVSSFSSDQWRFQCQNDQVDIDVVVNAPCEYRKEEWLTFLDGNDNCFDWDRDGLDLLLKRDDWLTLEHSRCALGVRLKITSTFLEQLKRLPFK